MGLLFLLLGIILVIYGLAADPVIYAEHSLGQNVNVLWGAIFVGFGGVCLWLVKRAKTK